MYGFYRDLGFSKKFGGSKFWDDIYKDAFPFYASYTTVPSTDPLQALGVDKIITTGSGKQIFIEDKADRHPVSRNVWLEYVSSYEKKTPGWIVKDAYADYLIYSYAHQGFCLIMPWQPLQRLWFQNEAQWRKQYFRPVMDDTGPEPIPLTLGCAIPMEVLQRSNIGVETYNWNVAEKTAAKPQKG